MFLTGNHWPAFCLGWLCESNLFWRIFFWKH